MPEYRCAAGHVSTLVFEADELKQPCPVCSITVYKFNGLVNPEEAIAEETAEETVGLSLATKHRRNAVIFGMCAVVVIVAAWGLKQQQFAPVAVSGTAPVLPVSSAKAPPREQPAGSDIGEVSITGFKAAMGEGGLVRASFELVNNGRASNDYPALTVHWKGSTAPDMTMKNSSYAHPAGPFTKVDVATEWKAPPDASGVEVSIHYE